jgi:hypothetical protein
LDRLISSDRRLARPAGGAAFVGSARRVQKQADGGNAMSKQTREAVGANDSLNDEELEGVCGGIENTCLIPAGPVPFAPAPSPNIGTGAAGAKKVPSGLIEARRQVDAGEQVYVGDLGAPAHQKVVLSG